MVTNLLIKPAHRQPLLEVKLLKFTTDGILGSVATNPLRQILILSKDVSEEFQLFPGNLRENLIVDYPGLHALPSGTLLKIGAAQIRLTFHCEPCARIKGVASTKAIQHRRGYLGQFLNAGAMSLGDELQDLGVRYEPIPYSIKDRINWYLTKQANPIPVTQLLFACGLSPAYARTIPGVLEKLPDPLKQQVLFKSHSKVKQASTRQL